jgi:hypothetical protein
LGRVTDICVSDILFSFGTTASSSNLYGSAQGQINGQSSDWLETASHLLKTVCSTSPVAG